MGGHDIVCQLCGVGFSVGRIRIAQEPRGAAWQAYGWSASSRGWVEADREQRYDRCAKETTSSRKKLRSGRRHGTAGQAEDASGCQVFRRPGFRKVCVYNEDGSSYMEQVEIAGSDHDEDGDSRPNSAHGAKNIDGKARGEDDESYIPSDEGEYDEPLEYSSDLEDSSQNWTNREDENPVHSADLAWSFAVEEESHMGIIDANFKPLGVAWVARRASQASGFDDDGVGSHDEDDEDDEEPRDQDIRHRQFEHIAGPKCQREDGYNGHHITVNEMLYGQTAQFLCTKRSICPSDEDWLQADDDLDFELESECFLTGLATAPPCSDDDTRLKPPRHGLESIESDNEFYDWAWSSLPRQGLPFHPTCFELFRQMSRATFNGRTDIDGLMRLRDATCKYPSTWPAEPNSDVNRSGGQFWVCRNGCEYLVANPIFVEALAPILSASVMAAQQPGFSIQSSAFEARTPALRATVDGDPFLRLPIEVMRYVLDYLGSGDIASLRLSSHAFQQLPISLWYRLVRDEMPYLYEAWSDDITPYAWASRLVLECEKFAKVKKELTKDVGLRWNVVKEEMPEILEEWIKNDQPMTDAELETQLMSDERRKVLESAPVKLELGTTDWYQLYRDITVNWRIGRLKGLRNRARIWKQIGQTINGIKDMKVAEGEDISMLG